MQSRSLILKVRLLKCFYLLSHSFLFMELPTFKISTFPLSLLLFTASSPCSTNLFRWKWTYESRFLQFLAWKADIIELVWRPYFLTTSRDKQNVSESFYIGFICIMSVSPSQLSYHGHAKEGGGVDAVIFFLDDQTSASDVLFISRAHFETSLVLISSYGFEESRRRLSSHCWLKMHIFFNLFQQLK